MLLTAVSQELASELGLHLNKILCIISLDTVKLGIPMPSCL